MKAALDIENRAVARKKPVTRNGFIVALLCAVALAFVFPAPGSRGGWLQPELLNNFGVALILFLQGLSMAVERMKSGAADWRVPSSTLLFPISSESY